MRYGALVAFTTALVLPTAASAQRPASALGSISDAEFWDFFTSKSEPGGGFLSDNFVSNEITYQHVIPSLQRGLKPQSVYLGVGPEQNFTYIAALKPQLAVIFDIRRQNAMQHLMFKALFELAPSRAEFVARLFSRPAVASTRIVSNASALFAAASASPANDSAYAANRVAIFSELKGRHGFRLAGEDSASIERVYAVFYRAGPSINYGVRAGQIGYASPMYPSFGALQTATAADSVPMAFLATEENYRTVREMHLRNQIIPVVGDFGGPTAIRSVGEFLRARGLTVGAFYVSNVEQYLFREAGAAERFYRNIAALPIDGTSQLIRSVPPGGLDGIFTFQGPGRMTPLGVPRNAFPLSGSGSIRISISDSGGMRITQITQDSAGVSVTRVLRDSVGLGTSPFGSLGGVGPVVLSPMATRTLLRSGLVSIRETLDAFASGRLTSYSSAIAMTKTEGWP